MPEKQFFPEEYETPEIRDDGNSFNSLRDKQESLTDKIHNAAEASLDDLDNNDKVVAVNKLTKEERIVNTQIQKQLDDEKALEDITEQTPNFG